jgi:hypothetical protein
VSNLAGLRPPRSRWKLRRCGALTGVSTLSTIPTLVVVRSHRPSAESFPPLPFFEGVDRLDGLDLACSGGTCWTSSEGGHGLVKLDTGVREMRREAARGVDARPRLRDGRRPDRQEAGRNAGGDALAAGTCAPHTAERGGTGFWWSRRGATPSWRAAACGRRVQGLSQTYSRRRQLGRGAPTAGDDDDVFLTTAPRGVRRPSRKRSRGWARRRRLRSVAVLGKPAARPS